MNGKGCLRVLVVLASADETTHGSLFMADLVQLL